MRSWPLVARRAAARIIDTVAELMLAWAVLGWYVEDRGDERVLDPPWWIVSLVIIGLLIYEIGFLRAFGATPGKFLMRLRVATVRGGEPGWGEALRRVAPAAAVTAVFIAVPVLSGGVLFALIALYATALADREGRGAVDRVADTRVVSTRS